MKAIAVAQSVPDYHPPPIAKTMTPIRQPLESAERQIWSTVCHQSNEFLRPPGEG